MMRIKERIKGLCAIGTAVVVIVIGMFFFEYVLNDDSKSYTRITLHELYEQENIDSIFVGASHVYRGINPSIADEIWNENTFNLSSSSQRIDASLALLKEANKIGDIDRCFLELSIGGVYVDKELRQAHVTATCIISDYMRPSLDKTIYMLRAVEPKNYINVLCRARRNWKNIYSPSFMTRTISRKQEMEYKNYGYIVNETEEYAGKGFVNSVAQAAYISTGQTSGITENYMSDDHLFYLEKMIKYCQEENIELICFSVPISEFYLEEVGNYDSFYDQMETICQEHGIPYYDFNLANPEVLSLSDTDFQDKNHLNGNGAKKFTEVFAEFFAGNVKEDVLFFDSYTEKKQYLPQRFLGLILERDETSGSCRIEPVSTKEDIFLYEVYYTDSEGNDILLQEKSTNTNLELPELNPIELNIRVYDLKGQWVFHESVIV